MIQGERSFLIKSILEMSFRDRALVNFSPGFGIANFFCVILYSIIANFLVSQVVILSLTYTYCLSKKQLPILYSKYYIKQVTPSWTYSMQDYGLILAQKYRHIYCMSKKYCPIFYIEYNNEKRPNVFDFPCTLFVVLRFIKKKPYIVNFLMHVF